MTDKALSGKVAIVTGAARGLGKATAVRLAEDGANVAVIDLNDDRLQEVVQEIRSGGGEALALRADVSNAADVEKMVQETLDRFGTIDILVNNAGLMRTTTPVEEISLEEWNALFSVNATGTFLCIKAVLPILKAKRGGKIINVSSSAGRCMSTFCGAHYSASKAAVLGLTRHTANEVASYGINVNAIAPGSFRTEGGLELLAGAPEEILTEEERKIPMQRFGAPQDQANLVAFLCSEESSYITGATIDINGGELMM